MARFSRSRSAQDRKRSEGDQHVDKLSVPSRVEGPSSLQYEFMKYDPEIHHRRSVRLKNYDYAQCGAYFVTIVTQHRICLFGDISDGEILPNDTGRIAQASWIGLSSRFSAVSLDSFVVMPNHIHGIITVGAQFIASSSAPPNQVGIIREGAINRAPTLSEIIRTYKAASTRMIRQTANPNFAWQRNYYEHVIRNEESLNRIRQYIVDNPTRWAFDPENPIATSPEPKDTWLMSDRPLTKLQSRVGATGLSPLRIQTPSKGS
jgi:putative transposase